MSIEDFVFPYGRLAPENEWVKLVEMVPWDVAEEGYAKQFVNNGHSAHPIRIALGSLIINQKLKCSDEWTVRHVSEKPYLQYFLGLKEYTSKCPSGTSTMVEFRNHFPPETIAALLAATTPEEKSDDHDDHTDSGEGGHSNGGILIMDATCCPADIAFPQDFQLLNEAREKLGHIIDTLCEENSLKRPRMKRTCARQDYLNLSKSKRRSAKKIREGIRKQIQYVWPDIGFIVDMVRTRGVKLGKKFGNPMNALAALYEPQLYIYENHVHNVANRIVSISQPWVRPIVQGKVHATAEFGTGKRSYGLNRIMAHLPETSFCVIGIALGDP